MKFRITYLLTFIMCTLLLVQCKKEITDVNRKTDTTGVAKDSLNVKDSIMAEVPKDIKYTAFIFPKEKKRKDSAMKVFNSQYSADERYTILALNRLDSKNKWRADTLIIPDKIETDFLAYSPFPKQAEILKEVKKIALFDYEIHAYALYENGKLVKWGPSSMGKKATPTKRGLMFTNWKKEVAISTSNSEWKLRWNFNVHNTLGIGWHQYDLPGFHASHSCMRLLEEDAKWMYNWAEQWVITDKGKTLKAKGTPVIVFGEMNFKNKPWLQLLENPKANDFSAEEMNDLVKPYLEEILKEQKNSAEVRNQNTQPESEREVA